MFGGGDPAGLHGFAAAVGGGADWHLNDTISLRIPQYDYSLMRISGGNSSGLRVSTGLVFKLRWRNGVGLYPVWRRDGTELFYLEPGPTLRSMSVSIELDPTLSMGEPSRII